MIEPRFLNQLEVRLLDDSQHQDNSLWMLLSDLRYDSAVLGARIIVPSGFVTDFASVPKAIPVAYALFGDMAHRAAVVHDWLYQTHLSGSREKADEVFREAMEVSGVSVLRAVAMFEGVRLGGGSAWDSGPERIRILNPSLQTESRP